MDAPVSPLPGRDRRSGTWPLAAPLPTPLHPPLPGSGPTLWLQLREQARRQAATEPLLAARLHEFVVRHANIERALTYQLSRKLETCGLDQAALSGLFAQCLRTAPDIGHHMLLDMQAALDRDPAAHDRLNVLLNQKGFQALQAHRFAHHLWCTGRQPLAQCLQGRIAEVYAMDIHPAARIGSGVFIDHGTGVVIGETAVVGNDCTLFQDVTLGGTGKERGDRHPKIGRGVLICAGAKILGNVHIGANAKVGAASVVLIDVPAGATAVGVPATVVVPRTRAAPAAAGAA
jgi:serine O-acetyltransferase